MSLLTKQAVLSAFIESRLNELHTELPCVVTNVDYKLCTVDVQPLVRDARSPNRMQKYPEIYSLPIAVYSAAGNSARVTLPVKIGDTGVVHFSEQECSSFALGNGRDITNPEEYAALGMYPLYYECGISPLSIASSISESDILIQNETTTLVIEPSGKITATCTDYIVNASGNITMNAETCTINAPTTVNGATTFNGNSSTSGNTSISGNADVGGITNTGGFACSGSVGGTPTVASNMIIGGISYLGHRHSETGDGGGTTSPPN